MELKRIQYAGRGTVVNRVEVVPSVEEGIFVADTSLGTHPNLRIGKLAIIYGLPDLALRALQDDGISQIDGFLRPVKGEPGARQINEMLSLSMLCLGDRLPTGIQGGRLLEYSPTT